ncbi:SUF system NifU family Fe-S cluster assembly protein [Fructilactobacillus vespulae]|uniref:Fe-S cluster assembly sulfur transfer protein SufU n=1 Tax=Fructilactobacillus vespulae TaxID=1249630 RepID=UPI0039B5087D
MSLRDMKTLYKQVVLENANHPQNFQKPAGDLPAETLRNPSCGDEITVACQVHDNHIENLTFYGTGCTISKASTSIMTETLVGKPVNEALHLIKLFQQNIIAKQITDEEKKSLGDAALLSSVAQFPTRIRCATLGWHVIENLINQIKGANEDD